MKRKIQVYFQWEHDEAAGISSLKCDCGQTDTYTDVVRNETIWTCSNCGYAVQFIWRGMDYIPIKEKSR